MSGLKEKMGREAFSVGFDYAYSKLQKDLKGGAEDLLGLAEKYLSKGKTAIPIDEIKDAIGDPNGVLFSFLRRGMDELDKDLIKTLFLNAVYEIAINGRRKIHEYEESNGVKVPRFILMEPTSEWNITEASGPEGADASQAGAKPYRLSFDEMNSVVKEGQDMGIFLYFFSGGEPLMMKSEILKLCEENPRSNFMCFTNGTLVNSEFGKEIKRVKNLVPIICLEELDEAITAERGEGIWQKMLDSMSALKEEKVLFGTAVCYSSRNWEKATSSEFVALERDRGAKFSMYSNYTPLTIDDNPELMPDPEQRAAVIKRIKEIRNFKTGDGMFAFDFQKDAEYLGGSIAGGRTYLHINARGEVMASALMGECAGNIKNESIKDIIKQPNALAYLEPVDRLYKKSRGYNK